LEARETEDHRETQDTIELRHAYRPCIHACRYRLGDQVSTGSIGNPRDQGGI